MFLIQKNSFRPMFSGVIAAFDNSILNRVILEKLPFEGRRHLPEKERERREAVEKAKNFRLNFLRTLKPTHPLYNSSEAREARGERVE